MLPEVVPPMEPVLVREPFDDPDFLYQVKWDGVRLVSFVEEGRVRFHSRRLRRHDGYYPELDLLSSLLTADRVVLDGEVVAFKDGRPSFPLLLRREQAGTPERARQLAEEVPVIYLVFDLLYLEGQPLLKRPLTERQEYLKEVLRPESCVQLVESFPSGKQLFRAVKEQGLEGIVAKRKGSPYLPGAKSPEWRKVKVRRRQLCLVAGYSAEGRRVRSLLLGAWQGDNKLQYLGRVGTGLTAKEWELLGQALRELEVPVSPFAAGPRGACLRWVKPLLAVWVEFSEWTEDLHLRAPSIVGFAKVSPEECRL